MSPHTLFMAHSVAEHLQVKIADYDRFIRTVIPHYDTMRAMQLEVLARCVPEGGVVLDLGGGTGALAAAVAEKLPQVNVQIWDTDASMLDVARGRCAQFGNRVALVERSYAEELPTCDAVVACIALHHVKDLSAKGRIYANIWHALRPGGIFANADCVMSTAATVQAESWAHWSDFMAQQGATAEEISRNFANWAKEDYYPPLATEMRLLSDAEFAEPDCFWRRAPFAVFGGVR